MGAPGGIHAVHTVNAAQQVKSVSSSLTGTGQPQYLAQASIAYTAWGAISQLVNGCAGTGCANGQETYIYNKRLQPWTIKVGTTANASADYCLVYNYFSELDAAFELPGDERLPPTGTTDNGNSMGYGTRTTRCPVRATPPRMVTTA